MVREALPSQYLEGTGTQRVSFTHGRQNQRDEDRILPSVSRGEEQRLESTKARVQGAGIPLRGAP